MPPRFRRMDTRFHRPTNFHRPYTLADMVRVSTHQGLRHAALPDAGQGAERRRHAEILLTTTALGQGIYQAASRIVLIGADIVIGEQA